jgi:hypothetical protein
MISPIEKPSALSSPRRGLILALREVIEALDRRVPQIERAGEIRIARAALMLRREAASRIEDLLRRAADGGYDDGLAEAIMTDDGGA